VKVTPLTSFLKDTMEALAGFGITILRANNSIIKILVADNFIFL
jgi:hypothetical protein